MINLQLFPSVIQYIENVCIMLQVFVQKNQDHNNAVTSVLQTWSQDEVEWAG